MADFVAVVAERPLLAEYLALEVLADDRRHLDADLGQLEALDNILEARVLQRRHRGRLVLVIEFVRGDHYTL